jgi:hypothetical protein
MANEASHKSAIIERRKAFCKRHYEAIAQAIQDAKSCEDADTVKAIGIAETGIAIMLGKDNPAFDADRFYRACVPGANVRARS